MSLIYVAAPYTHEDEIIVAIRVALINSYTVELLAAENHVLSMVTMCHQLVVPGSGITEDPVFWEEYSRVVVSKCDEVHVLKLPNWDISSGVREEVNEAKKHKIPIKYIEV